MPTAPLPCPCSRRADRWARPDSPAMALSTLDRPGTQVLIPAMVIVFVVLAIKFGSFQAYMQLLSRQTYTAFLPAWEPSTPW